jgi:hypothetical protein
MPTHAPRPTVSRRWILATCLGACVGTPTPEPPDNLPRPNESLIFGPRVTSEHYPTDAALPPIPIAGGAGSVTPDSELWVVNLDRAELEPATLRATPTGAFSGEVRGQANDRVRLVSRTDNQHSLPLDAHVLPIEGGEFALAQLPFEGLSCLTVTPEDELTTIVSNQDTTRHFTLSNACSEPVALQVRLRFGDAGFTLAAPTSLAAAAQASITVHITGHEDTREHADILLLDVQAGAQRGRYALGLWSVAAGRER